MKLEEVADISSGAVVKRFEQPSKLLKESDQENEIEDYYYLKLNNVSDNKVDLRFLEKFTAYREVDEKYLLKKGDIIMKLAPPYSAALADFDKKNLLVPSNFAIIRCKGKFDPGYLSFILNGPIIRKQLQKLLDISTIPVIKISNLKQFEVEYQDKKRQLKYANLFRLLKKKKELRMKIIELEDAIKDYILSEL